MIFLDVKALRCFITVFLSCGIVTGSADFPGPCPSFWTAWGDSCYRFYSRHVTWEEGEAVCNTFREGASRGHLVSIHSAEEQLFVYTLFKSLTAAPTTTRDAWFPQVNIGLRIAGDQSLSWSDGSPVDYTNWYPGEPNARNVYGQISDGTRKNGLWYDNDNRYLRPFMCKIPQPTYKLTYN